MSFFSDLHQYRKSSHRDPESGLVNYGKVDHILSRSALPDEKGYQWLAEHGVIYVVNFIDGDRTKDREMALDCGIREWLHFPLRDDRAPDRVIVADWIALAQLLREQQVKAHGHCKGNRHRMAMMAYIYARLFLRHDHERAFRQQMLAHGYYDRIFPGKDHSPIRRFCERFNPDDFKLS